MGPRLVRVAFLLFALALPATAAAAEEEHEREKGGERAGTPLERAKEESGVRGTPRGRFDLDGAELRVSPNELLAARHGQRLRFTVRTNRAVKGASLSVTLPRRWFDVGPGGLRTTRAARLADDARGGARLDRSGREVALDLVDVAGGAEAAFEVRDLGIPAGTYELPFSWRAPGGRRSAGTAKVVFYAPVREGDENPWRGLRAANVSNDAFEESETFIAATRASTADPNPNRVAVGINGGATSMSAWISNNGGTTFATDTLPPLTDAPGSATDETSDVCCDPTFAADDLGNIWYGGLTLPAGPTGPSRIIVNRLAGPNGTTFQTKNAGLDFNAAGTQDKPMMTVDSDPGSPTYGRLYVVWDQPSGGGVEIVISQCDSQPTPAACDDADNWSSPAVVSPGPNGGSFIYADVAVAPDGKVFVTWWDFSNVNAIVGQVCDPGTVDCTTNNAWPNSETVIATLDSTQSRPVPFACPIVAQPGGRAAPAPQIDIDHSGGANDGRVYVSWGDLRPGSGTTKCDDNLAPSTTHLSFDNFVASRAGSLPGGANPSAVIGTRLLTDGEGNGQSTSDDWFSWLAVDQATGQAYANFYSTRLDPTRRTTNFYMRAVTPSGSTHTLGRLVQLSSAASDYSDTPCCNFDNDYGDYTGLDAAGGVVWPVWSDNSTGDGEAFTTTPNLSFATQSAAAGEGAGADGDGFIEAGEPVVLAHTLANTSTVTGTGISGTLTPVTAGATVQQGSSTYPDLRPTLFQPGASPYQVTMPTGIGCNVPVGFDLALSATQQNTGAVVSRNAAVSVSTTCAAPPPPPPPPPPVAPPPPPPPPPVTPLTLRLSVSTASRRSFDTAFFSGIRASARCNRDCKLDARVLLDSRTAKKLRLKRQLARRRGSLTRAGIKRLVMKLSTRTQKKLSTLKSVKLSLRVVGTTADAQRRTVTKRITLKR